MDQNLFEEPFLLLLFMEYFYYGSLITQTSLATVFEAGVKSSQSHCYLIGKTTLHHGDMLKIGFFSFILCIAHDLRCETAYHIHLEILFQTL